jgi:pilus assembly protein Flp/PilA
MMLVTTSRAERFQPVQRRIATQQRRCTASLEMKQHQVCLFYGQILCLYKEISMQGMISRVQRFLVSEDGPTAVEYAVMLALILVACITIVTTLGKSISSTFNTVNTSLAS